MLSISEAEGSLQLLHALFEQTLFGIARVDNRTGKIVDINQCYCDMLGYSIEEMLALDLQAISHKDDVTEECESMENMRAGLISSYQMEKRYFDKNNQEIWVNLTVMPLWSPGENPTYHLTLVENINQRKLAEEKLQQQKEEQQLLFNSMVVAIISINENGEVLTFSKSAQNIFGYAEDEILGKNIKKLMPKDVSDSHQAYLGKYLKTGEENVIGSQRELFGKRKNGEIFPLQLCVVELPIGRDGKRKFIGSCQDISLQKQQEEQLRRSQKLDALGKLTGGIAHDYNNMLGIVRGYSDLVYDEATNNPKILHYVEEINRAIQRGKNLSRKLLATSRNKRSNVALINVNELLQSELELLEKTLTPRIELILNLQDKLWNVKIDSADFADSILNLTINAMHAMPQGGLFTITTRNVVLKWNQSVNSHLLPGEYVEISVEDSGCGMTKEVLKNIFDPFYTTKGSQGVGLGLSMVYGFLQRSGGDVLVTSSVNNGTKFQIFLPRNKEKIQQEKDVTQKRLNSAIGDETILVVDDEQSILSLTKEILSNKGYQVLVANSGAQALELLKSHQIDLMISDVIMPHLDGYELVRIATEYYPLLKTQLISGFSEPHSSTEKDNHLVKEIIYKPFSSEKLLAQIRMLLDESCAVD